MDVNETLQNTNLSQVSNYLSWLPRTLTQETTKLLNSNNIMVSEGWTSRLFLLFSLILLWLGIWILKKVHPIIKFAIIILGIILAIGLIYPFF